MAEPDEEGGVMTLRRRGAETVRRLAEVGTHLHPLKMKLQAGEPLTADEQARFDELETTYRDLEQEMRLLMRPRSKDPWVRGVDHLHGPDDPHE